MRSGLTFVVSAGLAVLMVLQIGCEPAVDLSGQVITPDTVPENGSAPNRNVEGQTGNTQPRPKFTAPNADFPLVIVGSFNIQTFGPKKMSKPKVVSVLVDIARKFDILAVQELRDGDERIAKEFLQLLNADGSKFAASVGPKQGYFINGKLSRYYEQAIFFYDTTKVELIQPAYVAEDRHEENQRTPMHRTPYVGYFRCINFPPEQAFSFVLMNVHIDPDDAHEEFESMRDVITGVYANHQNEDDFILLGDLNDEPSRYSKYGWMQQQYSAIPSVWKTNTRQSACYDNLVFDAGFTAEFTGESGILNLMSEYSLSEKQALEVSDHMPVWATFSTREVRQATVTQEPEGDIIR